MRLLRPTSTICTLPSLGRIFQPKKLIKDLKRLPTLSQRGPPLSNEAMSRENIYTREDDWNR